MTQYEALKLALEALEDLGMKHFESTGEVLYKETFTAIKEALARSEQEPVQWGVDWGKDGNSVSIIKRLADGNIEVLAWEYAPHPPQRTWVGLTDDEQQQAYEQWQNEGWGVFYRAIEAKLKEKNT